jgi:hypothetical protein
MTADTTAPPTGAEPRAFVLLKSRRRLDLLRPTMTSRPASRAPCDGAGVTMGPSSPNIARKAR